MLVWWCVELLITKARRVPVAAGVLCGPWAKLSSTWYLEVRKIEVQLVLVDVGVSRGAVGAIFVELGQKVCRVVRGTVGNGGLTFVRLMACRMALLGL